MGVYFESYAKSLVGAARQGKGLYTRVRQESWLKYAQPGVVAKYGSLPSAIGNSWQQAWNQNPYFQSHILRQVDENGKVRGVIGQSMIALDRIVRHPEEGEFRGTLVRYWLTANADHLGHLQVAQDLMSAAGALILRQQPEAEKFAVFTAVSASDVHPPIGLGSYLDRVGHVAMLVVPYELKDLYDAPSGTQNQQLYYNEFPLHDNL